MENIVTIKNTRKMVENEATVPLLSVINPNMTKPNADIKISSFVIRTMISDNHFIQEPLATVLNHEAW